MAENLDTVFFDATSEPVPVKDYGRYEVQDVPLLFSCGAYPDKQFSLNPAEAAEAAKAAEGQSFNMDLEHKPSLFDGRLGKLFGVRLNPNATFSAKVLKPKYLAAALPKGQVGMSLSWDRKTKRIKGCAWTMKPRVDGAGVANFNRDAFAAFAADEAANGPLPDAAPPPPEQSATAPVSENAPDHGSAIFDQACDILKKAKDNIDPNVFDKKYIKALDDIIDRCEKFSATFSGKQKPPDADENGTPSQAAEDANMSAANTATLDPRLAELEKENKALKDRLAAEAQARVDGEAVAFAESECNANRIMPYEKASVIKMYREAAKADTVTFSATGQAGESLGSLKVMISGRAPHNLTREQLAVIKPGTTVVPSAHPDQPVNFSGDPTDPNRPKMTDERRKQLLSMGRIGQEVLARRNGTPAK